MTALPAGLDPRTPVIVGAGQHLHREGPSPEPVELMAVAARVAESDAGASLLAAAQVIAVVPVVSWRYYDPARLVAERVGAAPAGRWYPAMGGNTPQQLVSRAALAIAEGDCDVALVCGGESYRTRQVMRRDGERPDWTRQDEADLPSWGDAQKLDMGHPAETAKGIFLPPQTYPLFENALRHRAGRSAAEHTAVISELWAGFSAVAATNPYSIDRVAHTAEEIATVTPSNRIIGFPYTKHMVSNPDVDEASAVILCSAQRAADLGIDRDRWVFPWSGTDGADGFLSTRPDFCGSVAMGVAGNAALDLAGVSVDDIAHLDVYSCFPSAVELACGELGISLDRQLTVYGGLCFAGGPWNNPVGHALATMVGVLREDPGSVGLVTANGGNVQKHAFGVYSSEPPADGFRYAHPQFAIDSAQPAREVLAEDHEGPVTIETWTVMHERDSSMARAHAAVLTDDGRRGWGVTSDPDVMAAMEVDDFAGRAARLAADGTLHV